jgi:hypothetical protein
MSDVVINAGIPAATVISQYANSPTIVSLINGIDQCINPDADLDNFYNIVWNVDTAVGFGLDIWGEIVGIERTIKFNETLPSFGFAEAYTAPTADTGAQPFNVAPFFAGDQVTTTYTLTDDAYRVLILCQAMANISDGSAPSVNRLLLNMFKGRGRCYCNDLGNMQMRLTFEFALEPYERAILVQTGVIPRPAGVKLFIAELPYPNVFGFAEAGPNSAAPFNQGCLFNGVTDANV